ncbi:MAG: hypothetical protein FJ271_09950 [Planctomycetes bacterium]|nr:hypothetical protein [Planctomycetota bacterium]
MVSSRRADVLLGLLVLCHLMPVWLNRYLPTQDGPAHLANAAILAECGPRCADFYEIRLEAVPNWTVHVVLAGLFHVVAPLTAEKVVVSVYVIGFAWSFRYFLGGFGKDSGYLAAAALLLLLPRCFWMGFYNYCLSMVLLWTILGYVLRRPRLDAGPAAVLAALFLACWFTHLVGFLLAVTGSLWLAGLTAMDRTGPEAFQARAARLGWIALAALPALLLTLDYFERSGFWAAGRPRLLEGVSAERLQADIAGLGMQMFGPLPRADTLATVTLVVYALLLVVGAWCGAAGVPRWPIACYGALLLAGYWLVSDHLPSDQGGFLKCRLAAVFPLCLLAACRPTPRPACRLGCWALTLVALSWKLGLVSGHVGNLQDEIEEFTAGLGAVGENRTLFIVRGDRRAAGADHLEHAGDYYCLGTGNVNLDNHEAASGYFPIRFREGVVRARGDFATHPQRELVDLVVLWDASPERWLPGGTRQAPVFQRDRLLILEAKRPEALPRE